MNLPRIPIPSSPSKSLVCALFIYCLETKLSMALPHTTNFGMSFSATCDPLLKQERQFPRRTFKNSSKRNRKRELRFPTNEGLYCTYQSHLVYKYFSTNLHTLSIMPPRRSRTRAPSSIVRIPGSRTRSLTRSPPIIFSQTIIIFSFAISVHIAISPRTSRTGRTNGTLPSFASLLLRPLSRLPCFLFFWSFIGTALFGFPLRFLSVFFEFSNEIFTHWVFWIYVRGWSSF